MLSFTIVCFEWLFSLVQDHQIGADDQCTGDNRLIQEIHAPRLSTYTVTTEICLHEAFKIEPPYELCRCAGGSASDSSCKTAPRCSGSPTVAPP